MFAHRFMIYVLSDVSGLLSFQLFDAQTCTKGTSCRSRLLAVSLFGGNISSWLQEFGRGPRPKALNGTCLPRWQGPCSRSTLSWTWGRALWVMKKLSTILSRTVSCHCQGCAHFSIWNLAPWLSVILSNDCKIDSSPAMSPPGFRCFLAAFHSKSFPRPSTADRKWITWSNARDAFTASRDHWGGSWICYCHVERYGSWQRQSNLFQHKSKDWLQCSAAPPMPQNSTRTSSNRCAKFQATQRDGPTSKSKNAPAVAVQLERGVQWVQYYFINMIDHWSWNDKW